MVEIDKYGRIRNRHYRGPTDQHSQNDRLRPLRHTQSRQTGLWARYDDFISDIGLWFEDNRETMSGYFTYAVLALVAISFVGYVGRMWFLGHPLSAIITAVIGGVVAARVFWIVLGILYFCFWVALSICRLVFKNAAWFTTEVVIAFGIYYLSSHQDVLSSIVEFAQSL